MNIVDRWLNKFTMYQVVLYGLFGMAAWALVLSLTGYSSYTFISLAGSLATLLLAGYLSHRFLRWIFSSYTSAESWLITMLIIFFIVKPALGIGEYSVLLLVAAIAMTSKYVLALGAKHIFNPAAITFVLLGLLGSGLAFWWVGSALMLPAVLVVGLAVARKTRRLQMVTLFLTVAITTILLGNNLHLPLLQLLGFAILSGPLIFFATIMLTEPATLPATRNMRLAFAVIVGLLYGLHFRIGGLFSSPQLALCLGNIFSFLLSTKRGYAMKLNSTTQLGGGIYEFSFTPSKPLAFKAGQYLEWTLPHRHMDSRGNRRYFTIASAPGESEVRIGVRIDPAKSSSFKRALLALQPGEVMWASQLAGDFTLPATAGPEVVCIAGGIGVTPFRSMVKQQLLTRESRKHAIFYTSLNPDGFTYHEIFDEAQSLGVKPIYVLTSSDVPAGWTGKAGFITAEMIGEQVPGYKQAVFYLSGPNAMVTNYVKLLRSMGVSRTHIHTDFFPGF